MRVLIVEDEPLLRSTLAKLLQAEPDVEVVASVADGEDAVRMGLSLKPDAVLMDLQLPSLSGIEATRQLYANGYGGAVVVLTHLTDDESLFSALRAGAVSYVLKDASAAQVVGSLRAAARGEGVIYPTLAPRVLAEFRRLSDRPDAQRELYQMLSRREVEVLEKIAEGKRNREIADELVLSERTVKNHVGAILKKLQVNDRAEAAEVATRHGLAGE
jgi:DNA-binding NarL/FixJ family response regulator